MKVEEDHEFRVPVLIPQDLQLIQDIIGELTIPKARAAEEENDEGIASSDNDTDSEKEVEEGILAGIEDDEAESRRISGPSSPTDVDSSSDSSDSDSEGDVMPSKPSNDNNDDDFDEDGEPGGGNPSPAQVRTKNEVPEPEISITIPTLEEVGSEEELEKVGEVLGILDTNVVVVRGASGSHGRAADRALDSETLLVFGDRKVLGYIYETFGPTHQPMYQVKFNSQYPLDTEKVQIAREVFHVPSRSNFVFVRQLKALKGSDASNAHDEEPAEDELEFSDDEEERSHRKALERKREELRAGSSSSRFSTPVPIPSRMRDQDIMSEDIYGSYDYSSSSYNDMDFSAGPSRPPPVPYDDPYSDQYGLDIPVSSTSVTVPGRVESSTSASGDPDVTYEDRDVKKSPSGQSRSTAARGRGNRRDDRGRGRGRDRGGRRGGDRGRGRDRGRGGGDDHSRGHRPLPQRPQARNSSTEEYDPRQPQHRPRSLSPTSAAIARATGQYSNGTSYSSSAQYPQQQQQPGQAWGYSPTQQSFDFGYGVPQGYVQPHINPRFAGQFGFNFNMGYVQQQQQQQPYSYDADYSVPTSAGSTGSATWPSSSEWSTQSGLDPGRSAGS